jgi:DNA modification methylase
MGMDANQITQVISGPRRWAVECGDCTIDGRGKIPDGAIDSVIVDPPYGMSYRGLNNNRAPILNDERPFIWFLPEAFRVLRDGGAILCFCQWRGQEDFRRSIELAGFRIMSQVIWRRSRSGMGHTGCTFSPTHDVIWFAVKGRFRFPAGRPASVLDFPNVPTLQRVHSTQKPTQLMAELVRAVTPPGGIVYDPCCGSGSTGVAAVSAGFRFIGMDLSRDNVAVARRRLSAAATSRDRQGAGHHHRPAPKLIPPIHGCYLRGAAA